MRRSALVVAAVTAAVIGISGSPALAADSDDNSGKEYIRTCGTVTCSLYYSHDATVRIDDFLRGPADTTDAMQIGGVVCGFGSLLIAPAAGPCFVLGAVAFGDWNVRRIIHHAATTNGCVRFRTVRGADDTPGPVYADHGRHCRSMD
ncbi:hypothetical protein ACTI_46420 [Actinoplanes sp. OR16]|uniref:hypothetical protein n=1 Tax=Actinoplanes sp. OR16 TaxID=946334 RepID=UPI000F706116|nr:hypothetical protein [Actinoplanes sp. OR16]BBH67957.1 hypothetical protein ACTI_46420 [Actinoplanes sp. OR16]